MCFVAKPASVEDLKTGGKGKGEEEEEEEEGMVLSLCERKKLVKIVFVVDL